MPSNIEIKARVHDLPQLKLRAEDISGTSCEILKQEDTFFAVLRGRLKLREFGGSSTAELIYYERPDASGPKRSEYSIYQTANPAKLKEVLTLTHGIRGVVRKTRFLALVGQTRIHIDDVEGLGAFMELEVVLEEGQSDASGQAIAADLMERLGVQKADLIEMAYMDLLEEK